MRDRIQQQRIDDEANTRWLYFHDPLTGQAYPDRQAKPNSTERCTNCLDRGFYNVGTWEKPDLIPCACTMKGKP